LVISFLLLTSSSFAGKKFRFNPTKPFAGKFSGVVTQDNVPYDVIYILKMDDDGNITGKANTYLNGQLVLPVTVAGAVNSDGKTADVTLTGTLGLTPSDKVRITLIGNGKKVVKMQYLDDNDTPILDVVKYKRLKK